MTPSDWLTVIDCARRRSHQAAADGDRGLYWREMAAIARLQGMSHLADDFDNLARRHP